MPELCVRAARRPKAWSRRGFGSKLRAMRIQVNGEAREVAAGITVSALLVVLGVEPGPVAVERNREIVPRAAARDHDLERRRSARGRAVRGRRLERIKERHVRSTRIDTLELGSRLIVGTGKYKDLEQTKAALEASGAEMVTVAVRRLDLKSPQGDGLIRYLREKSYTLLPNTAGCYTADDAVRTCRLARELGMSGVVKLEVLGDPETLFPDVTETLKARKTLVDDGFTVLPYTTDDPITAQEARGHRLRRGDAAGGADRQRARHPQSVQHRDHPQAGRACR